jgi:hypothetical protein
MFTEKRIKSVVIVCLSMVREGLRMISLNEVTFKSVNNSDIVLNFTPFVICDSTDEQQFY